MTNCTNDWTPVITVIAIQIPIIFGIAATWLNLKIAQSKQRAGHDVVVSKVDALTTIAVNGFHSPPISTSTSDNVSSS
jgi:hypothetical protein